MATRGSTPLAMARHAAPRAAPRRAPRRAARRAARTADRARRAPRATGLIDAVALDTSGDGLIDTVRPLDFRAAPNHDAMNANL